MFDPSNILYHKLKDIASSLSELLIFFINPNRYFKRLFALRKEERVKQTIYLIIFFSIITFLFIEGVSYRKQLAAIFIDVVATVIFCPILYFSVLIISKSKANQFKFPEVFLFVLHSKFLIGPLYFISYLIFIKTEVYEFYFLTNLFLVIQIYFLILFFPIFVFNKIKRILNSFLLNIILLNLLYALLLAFPFDSRLMDIVSKAYSDVVYSEYKTVVDDKLAFRKYPTNKIKYVFESSSEKILLLTSISDTLSTGSIDSTQKYISQLESITSSIDSIKSELKYERVKAGIDMWKMHFNYVLDYYRSDTEINQNNIKEILRFKDEDNNLIGFKFVFKKNREIESRYINALKNEIDLINISYKSESVYQLLYPTSFLGLVLIDLK